MFLINQEKWMMKKTKEVSFNYRSSDLKINAVVCSGIREGIGLMFKTREKAVALLFDFKKPVNLLVHSMFVFFPFIAVWLDEKNKVIDVKKIKPFTLGVRPKKSFNKFIEVPINDKYRNYIKLLFSRR